MISNIEINRKRIRRNRFTREEDENLRKLVARYGTANWATIAHKMKGDRTNRQVRERWRNYLNSGLSFESTEEIDRQIVEGHERFGQAWAWIAKRLGNRSPKWVQSRFKILQSHRNEEPQTTAVDQISVTVSEENDPIEDSPFLYDDE
jgi:superoxide dismutase